MGVRVRDKERGREGGKGGEVETERGIDWSCGSPRSLALFPLSFVFAQLNSTVCVCVCVCVRERQ